MGPSGRDRQDEKSLITIQGSHFFKKSGRNCQQPVFYYPGIALMMESLTLEREDILLGEYPDGVSHITSSTDEG